MANNAVTPDSGSGGNAPSVLIIRNVFDWFAQLPPSRYFAVGIIIVVAAILFTGVYRVEIDETAAKRRFGALVDSTIPPGLHWRFPFGVEKIDKFKTKQLHSIVVDTRIDPSVSTFTGDIHLINAEFAIQYKVGDLAQYLFQNSNPVEVLHSRIKSVFIDVISNMFVYMVLVTEKKYIEQTIATEVQQEIEKLKLGIDLVSINIVRISPPADAIPAFRAVNDAKAERIQIVTDAGRRAEQALAQAEGVAADILESAEARAEARVAEAESAARRFEAMLASDRINSAQTRHTHYWNTVKKYLGSARLVMMKPGETPNLAVNLLEDVSQSPALDAFRRSRWT